MLKLPIVFALPLLIGLSAASRPVLQLSPPSVQESQKNEDLNPDVDGIYHMSKEVTAPRLIYSVEPEFSEKARKRKISGNIGVKFVVYKDGSVRNISIVRSAAEHQTAKKDREAALTLDPKAIEAVSKYRFEPATVQGKPVSCWMTAEVNFQIF